MPTSAWAPVQASAAAAKNITYLVRISDSQQIGRQVALPEGLEVEVVRRLELALLEDRLLREVREALAYLARELAVRQRGLVQRRFDQREAHEGVFVVARHRVQHARRGRLARIGGELEHRLVRIAVRGAAEPRVDLLGDRLALHEHLARPFGQWRLAAVT